MQATVAVRGAAGFPAHTSATTTFLLPHTGLCLTCPMKAGTAGLLGLDTTDMHCPHAAPPWYKSEATTT